MVLEREIITRTCAKCNGPNADASCRKCGRFYHIQCVKSRATKSSLICDECSGSEIGEASGGQEIGDQTTLSSKTALPPKAASTPFLSTGSEGVIKKHIDMEVENTRLRAKVVRSDREMAEMKSEMDALKSQLQELMKSIASNSLPTPPHQQQRTQLSQESHATNASQLFVQPPNELHVDRSDGVDQNRSSIILNSIRLDSITKIQMEHRRQSTELPKFNGDPLTWIIFYSTFVESTAACGFSHAENLKRLDKALSGVAREIVEPLLNFPHRVPRIMELLEENFGTTRALMSAMQNKIRKLATLREDLKNLNEMCGAIESIVTAVELADKSPEQLSLMDILETKLPTSIVREWFVFADGQEYNILTFHKFICRLSGQMARLKKFNEDDKSTAATTTKKPRVMMVHTEPSEQKKESKRSTPTSVSEGCPMSCEKKHKLEECPKFVALSQPARWKLIKSRKLCVRCFGKHWPSKCTVTEKCKLGSDCPWIHHKLLHKDPEVKPEVNVPAAAPGKFVGMSRKQEPESKTMYRVLPIVMTKGNATVETYALLDDGSSMTMIERELARTLGLAGQSKSFSMSGYNDKSGKVQTELVDVQIASVDNSFRCQIKCHIMDDLSLPIQSVSRTTLADEGLDDLPLHCFSDVRPQLLIGLDNERVAVAIETRIGRSGNITASRTPLGWVAKGEIDSPPAQFGSCLFVASRDDELQSTVQEYIEADHFGLIPDEDVIFDSDNNLRARRLMEERTTFDGERYSTGLLWRSDDIILPDSRAMAIKRQTSLDKKLEKDPKMWNRLSALIDDYVAKRYIRQVGPEPVISPKLWYLPVFPAPNPNKPDKLRLVWDAAAKVEGTSLNDFLLTGPDLNSPLVNVLLRMRQGPIAFSADIMEMFHQVKIREEDRPAQRFLWRRGPDQEVKEYEMQVMTFGANCSPSLAQYVKNLNASRFKEDHPDAVDAIVNNHYVDDWMQSCSTVEEATALAKVVHEIHRQGGFNLRKWCSNSPQFLEAMGAPNAGIVTEVSYNSTVLGLRWLTSDDCFIFRWREDKFGSLDELAKDSLPTKRELLRMAMTIFDPLGFVSFITVLPRIILREVWKTPIDWDDEIPDELRPSWISWTKCLKKLTSVAIPRWYGIRGRNVTLHIFADASDKAMAAAAYIVCKEDGVITRSLVMAKCKVAPIKTKTIPRLELDAAVLAVRVLNILRKADCWTIDRVVLWSDARDILFWLRSTTRDYNIYVANRVANILSYSSVGDWRWVPSAHNPADWATKYADRTADDDLWWRGPPFLGEEEDKWPNCFDAPDSIKEVRRVLTVAGRFCHALIPPPENFSSWKQLVTNTACAFKFIAITKKQSARGPLTEQERAAAVVEILREVQKNLRTDHKKLAKFAPFKDEKGVWRMRGRAAKASHLTYDCRFPVILPDGHQVTKLIMSHYHRASQHGQDAVALNEFRQRYVVNNARRELNRVIRDCAMCTLLKTKPIEPQMAALPKCRLSSLSKPFSYTGVDLFGPIEVLVGRRHEKRWGVLFTCMTTRAVYLEIVSSLSATSCMRVLDSLVARRGMPLEIFSDNATNFVSAAKLFRGPNGCRPRWRFNPPGTPHMGGCWERLIGVTKDVLKRMQMEKTPTEERLRWFLNRAELLINSRPLTHLPPATDDQLPITPNDLLLGSSSGIKSESDSGDLGPAHLTERDEDVQRFWKTWTEKYLPQISTRQKWCQKTQNLAVGDVVLLCDGDYRKGWRRGVVEEAAVDDESQQVRQVVVRTADGSRYRRGAARVAPLVRAATIRRPPTPLGHQEETVVALG